MRAIEITHQCGMRRAPDHFQRMLRTGKIESNTLHVSTGLYQRVDGRLHAGHDGRLGDREAEIGRPCDAHARHPVLETIEIIDAAIGNGEGIACVRPREHVQHQRAVSDIARQAAIDRERAHRSRKIRHHAVARLQSEDAANAAGIRIEPPPSPPVARGTTPAATKAAEPPLEPPGVEAPAASTE